MGMQNTIVLHVHERQMIACRIEICGSRDRSQT